jgi:hypothetical protein
MPSGVGAPRRAARAFAAITLGVAGLAILAVPAEAQQEPTGGIEIVKVEIGGVAPATFEVTGPGLTVPAILQADVVAQNTPTPALPALPPLTPGTYVITETAPVDPSGQSVWELTSVDCGGVPFTRNENSIQIDVVDEMITCTFTDEVTRAAILGLKLVTGDTSSWVRPAQFHITCSGPDFELDIDIEPPVGPGGPGTYVIGQGSIPPGTCTISEIDTGSDGSVFVTMVMTNRGVPIAFGNTSLTFTSHAGDDLVLSVTNVFSRGPRPDQPSPDPGATTTIAGGSTTTTTAATTTTATTVPDGGATTTSGGAPTSSAPTTTAPQLPVTGSLAGGLIVFALVAMIGGFFLVARTRRPAEVRVEDRRD